MARAVLLVRHCQSVSHDGHLLQWNVNAVLIFISCSYVKNAMLLIFGSSRKRVQSCT